MAEWVSGILIFEAESEKPTISRFYGRAKERQQIIEKEISKKFMSKESAISDLVLVDKYILQIKAGTDMYVGVLYETSENDIIMQSFLDGVFKALSSLVGTPVSKRKIIEKLDCVFLLIDEVCESGIILDDDPDHIVARVEMRDEDTSVTTTPNNAQASLQSLDWKSMLAQAKGQIGTFLSR
jgi:hypothetical protein